MLGIKISTRAQSEQPRSAPVKYALGTIGCRCSSAGFTVQGGKAYCRSCGFLLSFIPEMVFRTREDLVETITPTARQQPTVSEDEVEVMRSTISSLEEKVKELSTRLNESETIRADIESELETRDGVMASQISRISEMTARISDLECKVSEADSEISDLEQTNRHLRSDLDRASVLNIRDIAEAFLSHITAVDNMVMDATDLDQLRGIVQARGQKLVIDLGSRGLMVNRRERGSDMGDGRMEVRWVQSGEESSHRKVSRCDLYGCSFRDSIHPDIVEDITVSLYVPDLSDGDRTVTEDGGCRE